tara:strand:+ start:115 stop:396 length:282 start_codon:yes stop_codon:yes gene_type:complete
MRKAILIKINKERLSKNGGKYNRTFWKDVQGNKSYIFDIYHEHYASKRFLPYMKEGNILDNLKIIEINNKHYISGYSNFTYVGNKNKDEFTIK